MCSLMFIKLFMFIKLWNATQLLASPRIIYILICWRTFINYEGSQEERKTEKQFWVRDSLFMQTLHYCSHCSLEQVTKLAKALLSPQLLHGPEATLLSFTRWQWLEGICTSGRSEKEGRMGNHEVQTACEKPLLIQSSATCTSSSSQFTKEKTKK